MSVLERAEAIVEDVIVELYGRSGFDGVIDSLDPATQEELTETLVKVVARRLTT